MLCLILVITLALPAFAQYEAERNTDNAFACSDQAVDNARENVKKCFQVAIKNSIGNYNTSGICPTSLRESIAEFVHIANKTCYHDVFTPKGDEQDFYKLILFSIKKRKYEDFIQGDGVDCIDAVKTNIETCVSKYLGYYYMKGTLHRNYFLWTKTAPTIAKKTCKKANLIKRCTLDAMRNEGWHKCHYDNDNILYVGSLFDYMLERCTRLVPGWDEVTQKPGTYSNIDWNNLISGFSTDQKQNMNPLSANPFQQQFPFNSNTDPSSFYRPYFNSNPFQSGFSIGGLQSRLNRRAPFISNPHQSNLKLGSFSPFSK